MKKLFVVSLMLLMSSAFGFVSETVPNGCGNTGTIAVAQFTISQAVCGSGYFLPADSTTCAACPTGATCAGGTFTYNPTDAQGIQYTGTVTQNQSNVCAGNLNNAYAVIHVNTYTCPSGQFLPADTLGCETCPTDAVCSGNTYAYNPTNAQGIKTPDIITHNMNNVCSANVVRGNAYSVFHPNSYNCTAGTYLPANEIACVTCPADSYCVGGSYTFNETTTQGLTACESGTHSSSGASSASQCIAGYTCTSGQYLPKNTTVCVACPNGYTCGGGTYSFDENLDQGIIANTITITWNGALQSDIETNNAGTCTYGGDIRTPVRADPAQIPAGKRFVGWVFRKPAQGE